MLKKVERLFSNDQIDIIKNIVNEQKLTKDVFVWDEEKYPEFPVSKFESMILQNPHLGKIMISITDLIPKEIVKYLESLDFYDKPVSLGTATYTEYSLKYGSPILRPHVDKVKDNLLIDYQLDTNTDWPIFIGEESFVLKDNNALVFYPGIEKHGRPEKKFLDEEYIGMIFFDMVPAIYFNEKVN